MSMTAAVRPWTPKAIDLEPPLLVNPRIRSSERICGKCVFGRGVESEIDNRCSSMVGSAVAWRDATVQGGLGDIHKAQIVMEGRGRGIGGHAEAHGSAIAIRRFGCAITLVQSGLACAGLGEVLDLTLCSAGSSTS
jgi:hypothetical protein